MTRTLRERLAEIQRQGLIVINITRAKHWKFSVAAPDGRAMLIVVSATPSNRRAVLEFRAQLKRFARPANAPPDSARRLS
jgi:hypothetical protein